MTHQKIRDYRAGYGLALLLALVALLALPFVTKADGNRVYYAPDTTSFSPVGSFGSMIPEGNGKGINKLTVNAGPEAYTLTFVINNNNNGTKGTTFFETRKGPTNTDLSGQVQLAASLGGLSGATNSTYLTFADGSNDTPLYVRVQIPACSSDKNSGTFRIQAHPSSISTADQGNGPGVVVSLDCNGYVPPPAAVCYDNYDQPMVCPEE
jgi:hypothetical protein